VRYFPGSNLGESRFKTPGRTNFLPALQTLSQKFTHSAIDPDPGSAVGGRLTERIVLPARQKIRLVKLL